MPVQYCIALVPPALFAGQWNLGSFDLHASPAGHRAIEAVIGRFNRRNAVT